MKPGGRPLPGLQRAVSSETTQGIPLRITVHPGMKGKTSVLMSCCLRNDTLNNNRLHLVIMLPAHTAGLASREAVSERLS